MDRDGAIRIGDLQIWLMHKATDEGGPWKYFLNNNEIFAQAHEYASQHVVDRFLVQKKIVDIVEFRTLLVQLFVISILWLHFKKAGSCSFCGNTFDESLNYLEFKLAVKSFCVVYNQEKLTEQQLRQDFDMLDTNHVGSISFAQVIIYPQCLE
jgi:hypothetical protein